MRAPEEGLEGYLHKSNGITVTKIPKKADEIGALGSDTDDLLEGATPWPARVSNIKTNDGCSDKFKVALQMGIAPEDLFVECPPPPQSGNIKTRAGLNEPASASACCASATNYLTAKTNYKNTDAMLGVSRCGSNKLPISFYDSTADPEKIGAKSRGDLKTIDLQQDHMSTGDRHMQSDNDRSTIPWRDLDDTIGMPSDKDTNTLGVVMTLDTHHAPMPR